MLRARSPAGTQIVVDIVVHDDDRGDGTGIGPGSRWAQRARPGDRVIVVGPRLGHRFGGIEFAPDGARRLLLVADETAAPAVAGVLRDLPADSRGVAFIDVPYADDVLDDLTAPPGVEVRWIPRDGSPRGHRLHAAVSAYVEAPVREVVTMSDHEVDPALWETPRYSSSGEQDVPQASPDDLDDLYAWVAGESKVVAGLRRLLVAQVGLQRRQVAFMGYWRHGTGTRS